MISHLIWSKLIQLDQTNSVIGNICFSNCKFDWIFQQIK